MYDVKSNISFPAQTAGIMNQGRHLGTADGSDVGALNLLRTDSLHRNSPVIHLAKNGRLAQEFSLGVLTLCSCPTSGGAMHTLNSTSEARPATGF